MTGQSALIDTGPLVALLNRRETQHAWVRARLGELRPPLLTCEAVLAEAAHLLRKLDPGGQAIMSLLQRGVISVAFHLDAHEQEVARLMARYADVPMSLADACLVRMSEIHRQMVVLTFDGDFRVYRRLGRQVVPILAPPGAG